MSLLGFQKALLAIYMDATARDSFFKAPHAFLSERDLSPRERKALLGLPEEPVRDFAEGIEGKRMEIIHNTFSRFSLAESPVFFLMTKAKGPLLYFNTEHGPHEEVLNPGASLIFKELAKEQRILSFSSLVEAYRSAKKNPLLRFALRDLFAAAQCAHQHSLMGRMIRTFTFS